MGLSARYSPLTITKATSDGFSTTYAIPVNGIGYIQPVGGSESFVHLALTQRVSGRLYCDPGQDIGNGDIIAQGGVYWVVVFADMPTGAGGVTHHKECLLSRYGDA
jgi:hypothetical protein